MQIVTDILSRLDSQVPGSKYNDEDWGQLDDYSANPPVKWPCCIVDVVNVQWGNIGRGGQTGLATVTVRIADLRLSNTSTKAPAGQRNAASSFWTLVNDVYKALEGFSGSPLYSKLILTSEARIKRDDGVRDYLMTFTSQIKRFDAVKPSLKLATTEFVTEINPELEG
ncbi:MAG TPA: hypothetical protein PKE30_16755 [Niabella sp.]|nr:hypothetical protein [Niabella sp.]